MQFVQWPSLNSFEPESSDVKPFCDCARLREVRREGIPGRTCRCGEVRNSSPEDWEWESSPANEFEAIVSGTTVTFHSITSRGTAIARTKTPLKKGFIHYWELRMITKPYGTDMVCLF